MSVTLSLMIAWLIEMSLGSLGAGGSILVVPALIDGLAVRLKDAVVQSLVMVG